MSDEPIKRPFSNPAKLLEIYRFMKEFEEIHECKPADIELVDAGIASSTSVIRYYYDRLEEMKMIRRPKLVNKKTGREFTPSRSNILLPLKQAHHIIRDLIQQEKENAEL